MANSTVKEHFYILMESNMQGSTQMGKFKAKEHLYILMVSNMQGSSRKANFTAKEYLPFPVGRNM